MPTQQWFLYPLVLLLSVDAAALSGSLQQVESIFKTENQTDKASLSPTYAITYDKIGAFCIRNNYFSDNPNIHSNYAEVIFKSAAPEDIQRSIYLVSYFNNFQRLAENQLTYEDIKLLWICTLKLKQGLYDHNYVVVDHEGNVNKGTFSGTHFATGNNDQTLVYHRRVGSYWDEMLGLAGMELNNKSQGLHERHIL